MIEKDPYIEEAIRELELLERDPERMDEYLFRQKNLSDYVTQMEYSREEGLKEGKREGEQIKIIEQVQKKMQRGKSETEIADALEEAPQTIASICRLSDSILLPQRKKFIKYGKTNPTPSDKRCRKTTVLRLFCGISVSINMFFSLKTSCIFSCNGICGDRVLLPAVCRPSDKEGGLF